MTRKVISFDSDITVNDGTNFTMSIIEPSLDLGNIKANMIPRHKKRPLIGGAEQLERIMKCEVIVVSGSVDAIKKLFDNSDGRLRILLISDESGTNRRYVECLCTSFIAKESDLVWEATLALHNDIYFRAENETVISWSLTGSPQTLTVNNPSKLSVYPRLVFRPTTNKSGTNPYSRTVGVRWRSDKSAKDFPVDITNSTLDTRVSSTDFSSATLADLRVFVNGVLVDFWFEGEDSAATSIWINLDFAPSRLFTLDGAIGTGDTTVTVNEDITEMPSSGAIESSNEIIFYTGKNDEQKRFTGCTRGARNTTATSHTDGATFYWMQHDIRISYGASSPTAYAVNDSYKPIIDLATSSNTSFDFKEFGEDDMLRAASWQFSLIQAAAKYTANQATDADPWEEMGIRSNVSEALGRNVNAHWSIYHPCGITNANFQSGQKYSTHPSRWDVAVKSSVNGQTLMDEYAVPAPSSVSSWQSWSQSIAISPTAYYVYLAIAGNARSSSVYRIEVSQVTLTLDSTKTPSVFIGSQVGNYDAALTLTNSSTSTAMKLDYGMKLNDEIEIDTNERTVTDLGDSSNQYQALTKVGGVRTEWWEFQPGDNLLEASDSGMAGATLNIYFRQRYYD